MTFMIGLVRGFFRFWYDFIVGDCWEIAAGVVTVLVVSVILVRGQVVRPTYMPFAVGGTIMLLVVLTTFLELRKKGPAGGS
jgi:hypothetical protein